MSTKLSAIKLMAVEVLDYIKDRIIYGDCSDEEIALSMQKINIDAHKDYINKNDYVNVDQAMKILGLGCNRAKFFKLVKEFGVVNHTMNNQHIGFLRKEIEEIACKMENN